MKHPYSHRIGILRALKLGDMICAEPAIRSVKLTFPQAHIVLASLPWASEFAGIYPGLVDEVIPLPGIREMAYEGPSAVPERLRGQPFDLFIQLHGDGSISNSIFNYVRARHAAGFFPPGDRRRYPRTFIPYPAKGRESQRLLSLVRHLGMKDGSERPFFPVSQKSMRQAFGLLPEKALAGGYACIHPGGDSAGQADLRLYALIANRLRRQGLTVILTGTETDTGAARLFLSLIDFAPVNLIGKTDLGTLGAIIDQASLFVSQDTGPAHIAFARNTPSVTIFTTAQLSRWGPFPSRRHQVIDARNNIRVRDLYGAVSRAVAAGKENDYSFANTDNYGHNANG